MEGITKLEKSLLHNLNETINSHSSYQWTDK